MTGLDTGGMALVLLALGCGGVSESRLHEPAPASGGGGGQATGGTSSQEPGLDDDDEPPRAGTHSGGMPGSSPPSAGAPSAGAPPALPFAPECPRSDGFNSKCSFEATCEVLGCGDGISRFDAQGCHRECTRSADCGAGQRCRFTALALEVECGAPSGVEGCWLQEGACGCDVTADCGFANVCVDAEKYPPSLDCDVAQVQCAASNELIEFKLQDDDPGPASSESDFALADCREKVLARLVELGCPYEAR